MRRLIREGDPPAGQLASPVPQYWNPNTEAFEDVLGAHGAPRAILYGPNGQPIGTQTNPLEVRVRDLEAKLDELKQTIESGVQLKGSVPVIWGANISERPAASEVPVGTQFILANENLDAWVSNGTEWVVI